MSKRIAITTICAAALLAGGCHRGAPEGQVAATVNGEEVTLQELNTEIQASNIPPNVDKKVAQQQALQRVIDRKLLVVAAQDKKIDKSPDYLGQKKRGDEILLAEMYANQQKSAVPVPTDAQISQFMADHPGAFANRQQLQMDQIRFRLTSQADANRLAAVKDDHTLDAVAKHLGELGFKFERGKTTVDTAQIPEDLLKLINGLPAGEPFVLPGGGGVTTINTIVGRQPVPNDPAQARQAAVNAWRQQQFGQMIGDRLKGLRDSAKISYQNGFAPPAEKKAPAPNRQ